LAYKLLFLFPLTTQYAWLVAKTSQNKKNFTEIQSATDKTIQLLDKNNATVQRDIQNQ